MRSEQAGASRAACGRVAVVVWLTGLPALKLAAEGHGDLPRGGFSRSEELAVAWAQEAKIKNKTLHGC